jgi:putative ferrous iron transport protein C
MILSDLRAYLETRRQATLGDLALHLRAEPDAVREMLSIWERKGRVRRLPAPAGCGRTCAACSPAASEVYLWVEPGAEALPAAPGCGR